jgi:butyrate kinase
MAKTKLERIADYNEQIEQIKIRQKQLRQQHNAKERKDRTRRLCTRAGYIESVLPGTIPLSDEQFKSFIDKALLSEYARKILNGLAAQNAAASAQLSATSASLATDAANAKPTDTSQQSGADEGQNGGDGARATG